jgi:hypothetical protein
MIRKKVPLLEKITKKNGILEFFGPIVIQEQSIYFAMHFMSIECSVG